MAAELPLVPLSWVCGVWRHIKKGAGGDLLSRPGGSIIGAGELDFRVRHGNGYFLPAVAAGPVVYRHRAPLPARGREGAVAERIRAVSRGTDNMVKPRGLLVLLG